MAPWLFSILICTIFDTIVAFSNWYINFNSSKSLIKSNGFLIFHASIHISIYYRCTETALPQTALVCMPFCDQRDNFTGVTEALPQCFELWLFHWNCLTSYTYSLANPDSSMKNLAMIFLLSSQLRIIMFYTKYKLFTSNTINLSSGNEILNHFTRI